MIRTRDFLLFVLAFVFLSIAITGTLATDESKIITVEESIDFIDATEVSVHNDASPMSNRQSYIDDLQEKILQGGVISGEREAVLTSVDTPITDASSTTDPVISEARNLLSCPPSTNFSPQFLTWPESASLQFTEGVMEVVYTQVIEINNGTSTVVATSTQTFLTLPTRHQRNKEELCIDENVIGVTLAGARLYNNTASQYASVGETVVLGYARDGFPVYGPTSDESILDQCGGVQTKSGYQYHIRPTENFVIACFAGSL